MKISFVSLFPDMFDSLKSFGITRRAIESGRLEVSTTNPRDFTTDKHRTVDGSSYGGGPGMVMKYEPLMAAIKHAKSECGASATVIYMSPQGKSFSHETAQRYSKMDNLIFLCGRYEGIDERVMAQIVDEECSIGDYILTGGELPAMVVADAVTRLLPGAIGDPESAQQDTFAEGLLDFPHYTKPQEIEGLDVAGQVPEVLLSGDHKAIRCWREQQALGRTWLRRPELLEKKTLTDEQQQLLEQFIQKHKQEKHR